MLRILVLTVSLALGGVSTSTSRAAEPEGWFGLTINVDAGGAPWSPTLRSATILAVAQNSPAAAGGIRAGDEILEVEGLTVAGGKAKELQAAMAKSVGQSLRMRLRHSSGETYTVVMTAAKKPPIPALHAGGFDTPEDAERALEQAYVQKNADAAVAVMDFVEEGRQMLQKINPTLANDPDAIKQAAQGRELAFRNELRTEGFPDFANLNCSFVGKTQIAPGLVKLMQQCVAPDGSKSA